MLTKRPSTVRETIELRFTSNVKGTGSTLGLRMG